MQFMEECKDDSYRHNERKHWKKVRDCNSSMLKTKTNVHRFLTQEHGVTIIIVSRLCCLFNCVATQAL